MNDIPEEPTAHTVALDEDYNVVWSSEDDSSGPCSPSAPAGSVPYERTNWEHGLTVQLQEAKFQVNQCHLTFATEVEALQAQLQEAEAKAQSLFETKLHLQEELASLKGETCMFCNGVEREFCVNEKVKLQKRVEELEAQNLALQKDKDTRWAVSEGENKALQKRVEELEAENSRLNDMPMQPLVNVDGIKRFKANRIVDDLLSRFDAQEKPLSGGYLNDIAMRGYTDEERMQFAQLIGYSVSGYGDLSYVSDESYERAEGMPIPELPNTGGE